MPGHRTCGRPRRKALHQGKLPGCGAPFTVRVRRIIHSLCGIFQKTAGHPEYVRVVRGAFLAPWFAVGLGIVFAATLSAAAPRAVLTFPSTGGGRCAVAGCGDSRPDQGKGREPEPARPTGRQRVPQVRPEFAGTAGARIGHPPAREASRVQIKYGVLSQGHHRFMAMILITAHSRLGKWTLRLRLPGTWINSVMWGKWSFSGDGMLIITGEPLPWPRSAPDEARIVIFGTGRSRRPGGCRYDGSPCAFERLHPGPGEGHRDPVRSEGSPRPD